MEKEKNTNEDVETILFVGSMNGDLPLNEENIGTMNDIQNEKAKKFLVKHPNAIVGKINQYDPEDENFERLDQVLPLFNFSYSFAIPQEDPKIYDFVYDWNKRLNLKEMTVAKLETFQDMVEEVGGIHFYWIQNHDPTRNNRRP